MSNSIVFLIINYIASLFILERVFTLFQQNGYELKRFFSLPKGKKLSVSVLYGHIFISDIIVCAIGHMRALNNQITFVISFVLLAFEVFHIISKHKFKVPARYTKRMKRLFFAGALAMLALELLSGHFEHVFGEGLTFLSKSFTPLFAFTVSAAVSPFEKLNNKRYIKKAKKAFSEFHGIKVGITGSYAKTSVKNILAELLSAKYNTLISEKSFNTPLGLSLTSQKLSPETEAVVCELGARKRGDIKELIELFPPDIGILTGVTCQHLETFKSLENIYKEKMEILNAKAFTVYNADDKELAFRLSGMPKVWGASSSDKNYPFFADNICLSAEGTSFKMRLDGETAEVKTKLLGRHCVINILMAAAAAYRMGVSIGAIAERIACLDFIPHRLELITAQNGVNILDDSYNGNPEGAKSALETLKLFKNNRIVMTAGLVELGETEASENRVLGERIGEAADIAILIGARGADIEKGLTSAGFDSESIYRFGSLSDAQQALPVLLKSGDTLLILNDLPDKY